MKTVWTMIIFAFVGFCYFVAYLLSDGVAMRKCMEKNTFQTCQHQLRR